MTDEPKGTREPVGPGTIDAWIATTASAPPLTRELLDKTMEQLKNRRPERVTDHPHAPQCACLKTQHLPDCNCSTRAWLNSIGFGGALLAPQDTANSAGSKEDA